VPRVTSRLQGTHNRIRTRTGRQVQIGAGGQRARQTRDKTGGGTIGWGTRTRLGLRGLVEVGAGLEGGAGWREAD
jgi:hypothetical protein